MPLGDVLDWGAIAGSYRTAEAERLRRVAAGVQPDLPWMNPSVLVGANAFYLGMTFLLYFWMSRRTHPIDCVWMRPIMIVYNLSCVVLAGMVARLYLVAKSEYNYPAQFVCNANQDLGEGGYLTDEGVRLVAYATWLFYAQKFWEFLDTWFFILRKSFRQVTFLHVFHHCSINIVVGLIGPHTYNGDMYLPIVLNACVHVLMYGHYLSALLHVKSWWKPYLTTLQLTQFSLIALQMYLGIAGSCGAHLYAKALLLAYMGSMLLLFGNFFLQTYVLRKQETRFGGGVVKRLDRQLQEQTFLSGSCIVEGGARVEVPLPPDFIGVLARSENAVYQLTAVGKPMPGLHVAAEATVDRDCFSIGGGDGKVNWTISAINPKPAQTISRARSCCEWDAVKTKPSPTKKHN
jgi:hypothetical protein